MKRVTHNSKAASHPRSGALKKLLALGDLPLCDVLEIMGGDRSEIHAAINELLGSGEVVVSTDWSQGVRFFKFNPAPQNVGRQTPYPGGRKIYFTSTPTGESFKLARG